jgi:hypothetical protein
MQSGVRITARLVCYIPAIAFLIERRVFLPDFLPRLSKKERSRSAA